MALALAAGLLAGCGAETWEKVLPLFFDGITKPGPPPPTRRVRRDLLREIEELKRELAEARAAAQARADAGAEEHRPAVERAESWAEAERLLPRDPAGQVDWSEALRSGAIAPRPAADPRAPAQAVLDLDLELARAGSRVFRARFSHGSHTAWLACGSCHPSVYPLARAAPPTVATMAAMQEGRSCGVCHGSVAFGLDRRCARCHPGVPARVEWRPPEEPRKPIERAATWDEALKLLPRRDEAPDWGKALAEGVIAPRPGIDPGAAGEDLLDLEVTRTPGGDEAAKVVFPHAAHTAWLKCESCHPEPYEQEGGKTPMSMERINAGELCGTCHGKVAFPLDACGRCHPAMGGG